MQSKLTSNQQGLEDYHRFKRFMARSYALKMVDGGGKLPHLVRVRKSEGWKVVAKKAGE